MNHRNLESELRELLAELSRQEVSRLSLDADLVRELGLDSLTRLRLLAGVEKRWNVRFRDSRLAELRTLRQLIVAIQQVRGGDLLDAGPRISQQGHFPPEPD